MKKTTLTRTVTEYESLPFTHLEPGDVVMLVVNRKIRPEHTPRGWMNLGCETARQEADDQLKADLADLDDELRQPAESWVVRIICGGLALYLAGFYVLQWLTE